MPAPTRDEPPVAVRERDPRIDPRPGDRLRKDGSTREVIKHLLIYGQPFVIWTGTAKARGRCNPDSWRAWAKSAEVIKRGK